MNRDLNLFESVFKRALRKRFRYNKPDIRTIMLITDLSGQAKSDYEQRVRTFLDPAIPDKTYHLEVIGGEEFNDWKTLAARLEEVQPHLIVSYRLLRVAHAALMTSLGVYIDTLSQITQTPILVLPNPHLSKNEVALDPAGTVVVATEHLYEDHSLVNYGILMTPEQGSLQLVHIEDKDTFEYYMTAIEKIPELNTGEARGVLEKQLISGPLHYNESVREVLAENRSDISVKETIEFGHLITEYKKIIQDEKVSLLVLHSKDDTQLAMHSLGYSLAVEFKHIPVLLV